MADTKINIKFPLEKSSEGAFATNSSTLDAVESDLRILIMTNYGERLVHWDFGANLRAVLFEQMGGDFTAGTDLSGTPVGIAVEDSINAAVEKWMPFVTIEKVNTVATGNSGEVSLNVTFSVGSSNQTKTLMIKMRA